MKKIVTSLTLLGMLIFSGCSSDTTNDNLGVLDEDKPRITLYGETDIYINLGVTTVLENDNFVAEDTVDGDLTAYVERTHNIDFTRAGEYQVTYFVQDSDGFTDTQIRNITIVDSNSDLSTNNPNDSQDLGTEIGGVDNNTDLGTLIGGDGSTYSDIESFKVWYTNVCGQVFNESLYDATSSSYNGTITCSNSNLYSVDLSSLSIFTTIKGLDLSNNNLTEIDFNQLELSVNNVKILEDLDLSNNNFSYIDFTPLHNLKNINNLWIQGNNLDYDTEAKRVALYEIFNNKSLTIYF